jgi:hypothetical protein
MRGESCCLILPAHESMIRVAAGASGHFSHSTRSTSSLPTRSRGGGRTAAGHQCETPVIRGAGPFGPQRWQTRRSVRSASGVSGGRLITSQAMRFD